MNDTLVLTIDNDAFQCQLIDMLLSADKYRLEGVSTAQEAFLFLQRETPDILLVASDLPDLNGADLCSRVKSIQRFHQLPVILLVPTGQLARVRALAPAVGADLVFEKPLGDKQLREHVSKLLKNRAAPPSLTRTVVASPKAKPTTASPAEEQAKQAQTQSQNTSYNDPHSEVKVPVSGQKATLAARLPSINLMPKFSPPHPSIQQPTVVNKQKTIGAEMPEDKDPLVKESKPEVSNASFALEKQEATEQDHNTVNQNDVASEVTPVMQFETVRVGSQTFTPTTLNEETDKTAPSASFNTIEFNLPASQKLPPEAEKMKPSSEDIEALESSNQTRENLAVSEPEAKEVQEDDFFEEARIVPVSQSPFAKEVTPLKEINLAVEQADVTMPLAEPKKVPTDTSALKNDLKEGFTLPTSMVEAQPQKDNVGELALLHQQIEQLLDENQQLKEAIREFKSGVPIISSESYLNAVEELEALRRLTEFQDKQIKEFYKQNAWIKQTQSSDIQGAISDKDTRGKTVWNRIVGGI